MSVDCRELIVEVIRSQKWKSLTHLKQTSYHQVFWGSTSRVKVRKLYNVIKLRCLDLEKQKVVNEWEEKNYTISKLNTFLICDKS